MFQWKEEKGLLLLTVSAFAKTGLVRHGFTTRLGGVSEVPYHSLNMGFTVADDPNQIIRNREQVAQALGFPLRHLVAAKQVHGDRVAVVTVRDRGKGALDYTTSLPDTDALITAELGVPISSYHADCVPVFFLDPVTPAIGLAHAGWKGTALKIVAKTLIKMGEAFGTKAKDCLVAIGPSIGPCCYEVGKQVKDVFSDRLNDPSTLFRVTGEERWHLDLWAANFKIGEEAGVPRQQIFVSKNCTACHSDKFFSYRKEAGITGRMAALMMLQD